MWRPVDAITNKPLTFVASDWPMLIHGAPSSGASFCTITLAAENIRLGKKVVFLCARGEAIRALQRELDLHRPAAKFTTVTSTAASALEDMQLVTLFQPRRRNLLESLRALKDWGERIVIIDNAEEVLTPALWAVVQSHVHLIISGDFRKTTFQIDDKHFPTTILFSPAPRHWRHQRDPLPSYIGQVFKPEKFRTCIVQEVNKPCIFVENMI